MTKINHLKYIRSHGLNLICLVILLITLFLVVYYRLKLQMSIGPFWDTYSFLDNALEYAGIGTGYIELDRSPFLPFLTSLLFRAGFVSEMAIYLVDGIIFILGVVGLYHLLRLRFNSLESLAGCAVYISFPVILAWLGVGYLDIAAVSFSIWAIYTTVLAVKKNPRYFYLAFPLAMIAFLTRFTAGFIVFPIILYILMGGNYLRHLKQMLKGLMCSVLIIIPYLLFMYQKTGDPFITITSLLSIQSESVSGLAAYSADPLYYLKTMDLFVSIQGQFHNQIYYLFLLIIVIGVVIYLYNLVKSHKFHLNSPFAKLKILILAVLLLGFIFTFSKISSMASIGLVVLICYMVYDLMRGKEKLDLDLLFVAWFMAQFIVHAQYAQKVDRYFITMAPALVYFLILGLNQIAGKLKINYRQLNLTRYILPLLLLMVALLSTTAYLTGLDHSLNDNYEYLSAINQPDDTPFIVNSTDLLRNKYTADNLALAANWLKEYDPQYSTKKIRSNQWPGMVWNLRTYMDKQPTWNTTELISHELEKNNIDYYISTQSLNLEAYPQVAQFGDVFIYQKDPSKIENKTQMLYIGQNWQNYIDEVLGFKAYVIYENLGQVVRGKPTEIDSHSLEELQKYPYLLLYNFKWNDQEKAEELLTRYVESGGTLVIDASGNLEGSFYNLDNAEFMNTIITRKSLEANPKIEPNTVNFSPFLSDGETWYGAHYEPTNQSQIQPLVTADGNILIGEQKIGKGRIIWIGYNLVWHAFHLENPEEKVLIQSVIGV
ncbi:glycosyltransferase family 39 protein [Methanobacterium formicicum]|uniref:Glycosyltransferase family 39 protein n=1 Tax=Methanobacterium formicicum TaxID=2162 RepID=A0A843AQ56_METFO|nr:glycosyltransferase family 39 protein [Methanobacterium formicicum]MBF4475270.1 glycosyltransferase family 39 protein [Methanobacterium formicicum]